MRALIRRIWMGVRAVLIVCFGGYGCVFKGFLLGYLPIHIVIFFRFTRTTITPLDPAIPFQPDALFPFSSIGDHSAGKEL